VIAATITMSTKNAETSGRITRQMGAGPSRLVARAFVLRYNGTGPGLGG
jgi:hypothetical protein